MALLQGASRPASSCSPPSSSSSPPWRYQVFLSFRGEDTRNNFTAHLYDALRRGGINTYIDKELKRGEEISPALFEAIDGSNIAIIILSPHYASSTWCLKELMKILECQERKQQIVLPVFYYVDPSDVKHQTNTFKEDFAKHEVRFKDHEKINVQLWKDAFTKVGNLSGFHLTKERNESEFIDEIIQWVDKSIITHTSLHVANYPVGIDSRVQGICSHLCVGMNDVIRMVGILGCGGIGKTTIAKAIYNLIAKHFEATCFLPDVRETSARDGLVKLQEKLLSKILGDPNLKIDTVDEGMIRIKERICRKRILLILDDVDQLKQLEKLAGERDWFGSGSRIIVTTRDRNVLTNHDVDFIYEVESLNWQESLQLFNCRAFKGDNPQLEEYRELTEQIIHYVGGIPLALQVLGSDLRGKSICEWKSALKDYRESPHQDIQKVLRISYDGLGKNEKNIFLDIACFFKGMYKKDVMKVLDNCDFSAEIGIARLMDKCLISTNKWTHQLEMHDLLQEMGREIVREESPEEPGGRSRLWSLEDVRRVLEENTGTNKIEAIVLNHLPSRDDIQLSPDAFMEMKRLRLFLIKDHFDDYDYDYGDHEYSDDDDELSPDACFCGELNSLPNELKTQMKRLVRLSIKNDNYSNVLNDDDIYGEGNTCFSGELNSLPNELKVIDWNGYHLPSLPSNFRGNKLSYLKMTFSCIQDVRMDFQRLTVMNFSRSELLTKIPYLSRDSNLKELILSYCTNLEEIHDSVGLLDKLVRFDLRGCSKLCSFPRRIKLRSLEFLDLRHCSSLLNFPEIEGEMENLHKISLNGSGIKELPSSIINISRLCSLNFEFCVNLTHLPDSIFQLQHLESLRIKRCPQFRGFREKLMEDNSQFRASIMPNREYEFSVSPLKNSSISIDDSENLGFSNDEWASIMPNREYEFSVSPLKNSSISIDDSENLGISNDEWASIMPNREYEFSVSPPKNSSISNDDCYKEAAVQALEFFSPENYVHSESEFLSPEDFFHSEFEVLSPENFVHSELRFFRNNTWQLSLGELNIIRSDIVSLPASIKRLVRLRSLNLKHCKQLQEIPELPQNIERVNASGCISLESFPQVSKKFQFDTSGDSLDKLIWLGLCGCHKMLKKLRNPVLSSWLRKDYALDGIADYRRGLPTRFSHRNENRCRISVNLQGCLEEAITIVLCAVIMTVHQPYVWYRISGSASVVCEGRSPRHVEGTTVYFGYNQMRLSKDEPHLFLAYTRVEPSELEGNHLEVEFSASYLDLDSSSFVGGSIEFASCEVYRVDEHKKRVETQERKRDDVLQMVVSNGEPENLLDLLTVIELYLGAKFIKSY